MRYALLSLVTAAASVVAADPVSIRPLGADGQPLNLNFEAGSLKDWTTTGEAFKGQPVKGPIDPKRPFGADKVSNHQGDYWIGGYELLRDEPKGTLVSAPFKVTQPWASFLIAGGDLPGTRVEIVMKDDNKAIHTARGQNTETLARSVVDLRKFAGRDIFIRVIDEQSEGWGHVNFDDFVFHDAEPKFANVIPASVALVPDQVQFDGLSPEDAAKNATVPAGFELKLFAGEPDIVNPIAFCIDERARLWVVESHTYPIRAKEGEGRDRVLIFEDRDGDGRFDRRTVFMETLNLVSGIAVGFGGVWIGAAPHFLFVPVTDGDTPKPAGEPRVLLDGWGHQDTHETLNTFIWGPDGWLYGCHGVFTHSKVGKPGAPEAERTPINAGYWRYHPTRHTFEVFGEGTSNPWGIDFDTNGQLIAEACVIPHLFHIAQGGRYTRQGGQHFNRHTYDDIVTIADHRHYLGPNPHGGNGRSDNAGGGHAHAGLLIYEGGSWPAEYAGKILMGNIHGQRINVDVPEPAGSGFVGRHGADFVNFNDRFSQVVNILPDQDGSVFFIDWYDRQQCHTVDPTKVDQTSGRIFKLVYQNQRTTPTNLAAKGDDELIALVTHRNEWLSRTARRLLQERAASSPRPLPQLEKIVLGGAPREALRALWTLHATGQLSEALISECLARTDSPHLTAWAVQSACEGKTPSEKLRERFATLANASSSPVVRLYLASAMQRLPIEQRQPVLEALIAHGEDATDQNLPLMYWYALEPLVGKNPAAGAALLGKTKIPRLQEFIARRMAATAGN
jgi:putative membrane-bound dehydrogenase-like protein